MGDSLGESSSQASLHTTAHAAPPAAASAQKGKGGHISALRNLGLLHELQEYVSACVETQQQQEKELGKLKAEKKQVERVSGGVPRACHCPQLAAVLSCTVGEASSKLL